MSALVVVSDLDRVHSFLTFASAVAGAKHHTLTVLCWTPAASDTYPLLADKSDLSQNDLLVARARSVIDELGLSGAEAFEPGDVQIRRAMHPDITHATLAEIREGEYETVIVESDPNAATNERTDSHPLLRRSPCETILFCRLGEIPKGVQRVLVVANDSPHDKSAFEIFGHERSSEALRITFARIEDDGGAEATELGQRELKRMMRSVGIKQHRGFKRRVFSNDSWPKLLKTANDQQLVLLGADQKTLFRDLNSGTSKPAIAMVKRAPPLRRLGTGRAGRWKTRLSPADYADLMQGLRRGVDLNTDFLVMLGLAAAIASLGLLQNSPAVVIGSMLLAPLMTPMIACGLAIAQANKKLGRRSMAAIAVGFLLTLAVSLIIAIVTPGNEITSEIVARGKPNLLDLLVALLSAAAAAYALARPSIVGAIAGVAIATALVPPLCSAGISLAYGEYLNAHGAALLFTTNVVAIILGAAVTFRMLGVTFSNADSTQRRWVYRISTAICVALIVLAYPLTTRLDRRIVRGQAQARTYPLTKATDDALVEFIERTPEIELVASGRPSTQSERANVVLVLSSPEPLSTEFANQLVEICRQEMGDPELDVEVHCFLNAFQSDPR